MGTSKRSSGFSGWTLALGATLAAATLLLVSAVTARADETKTISLTGAGATFPYPMYSKWFDAYKKLHPEVEINYQAIGSGGGIRQVTEGTVDFGASDGPMTDKELKAFKDKQGCNILHFPTVMGGVVPTYNIPGVSGEIKFTGKALAGIYLGIITKWNDPDLQKVNPNLKLPDADIVVIHRSDGSGTTYIWADYLSKISAEWRVKVGVGTSVKWPVGLGGKGNPGVAGLVKQTPNAIGYVELIYALQNNMDYGSVENSAGKFVKSTLASVTDAAAGAAKNMPDDFRVSITNAPGEATYPIASFTWLLIPDKIKDETKRKVIVDFLKWMMTDGQKMTEALGYAPLPKEVVAKEMKALEKIGG
jgi:phosphate transport system substrate-binding protein